MSERPVNAEPAKGAKHARCVPAGAFTLIESLAVVVLLAIAVSTLAVGLTPSADLAAILDARSAALDADARARALARRGEPVLLRPGAGDLTITVESDAGAVPLVRRELPRGITVSVLATDMDRPVGTIRFGADGRSEDYLLRIASSHLSAETWIAGLTGYASAPHTNQGGHAP
ncbi:MAG: type II secretion system protein [Phycisphaerales bacterium]|nr:type II secretion system protein [Phycisphaerales bacterium]